MLQNISIFEIFSKKKSCSDWAQKLKLRVLGPRDSENQLRSAYFFSKKIFFGIFLTTILKINPKINPNINPKINSEIKPKITFEPSITIHLL